MPGKVVCQPAENKWAPRDEYDAKFSLPFVVSAALSRGRFTLAELEDDALGDPEILALARRVEVIAAMWEIALADGQRTADEDAAVRLAAGLLGVSDVESAQARQHAQRLIGTV